MKKKKINRKEKAEIIAKSIKAKLILSTAKTLPYNSRQLYRDIVLADLIK